MEKTADKPVSLMLRIPPSLHKKMLRHKEKTGVPLQRTVLAMLKGFYENGAK